MTLEIISKLTPDEYKLCMFVMGWLGTYAALELGMILTGEIDRFTQTPPSVVKVIQEIARNRHIEKQLV